MYFIMLEFSKEECNLLIHLIDADEVEYGYKEKYNIILNKLKDYIQEKYE